MLEEEGAKSFQKIEGLVALERRKILTYSSNDLNVGNRVIIFVAPDGSLLLEKSETNEGWRIARITPAYICFEEE